MKRTKSAASGPSAKLRMPGLLSTVYQRLLLEPYCFIRNGEFRRSEKQVWVHIGAHKTATTTVQTRLQNERARLRQLSISYDRYGYRLAKQLMLRSPLSDAEVSELAEFWRRRILQRNERITILSGENFCGDPYAGYSNAKFIAQDLRRIFDGFQISILAVVRRQDRWLESIYQQYIKGGRSASFDDFASKCGPFPICWDELLDSYASQFGEIQIQTQLFETLIDSDSNLLEGLFGRLTLGFQGLSKESRRSNPGVSPIGLEVLRRCNELLSRQESVRLRKWVESNFPAGPNSRYRYFTHEAREQFLRQCTPSNARLFQKYIKAGDPSLYGVQPVTAEHPETAAS